MAHLFRTILVPTDFSELSKGALSLALDLADRSSRIVLCHVVDDVPMSYDYLGLAAAGPDFRASMEREASLALDRFAPAAPEGITLERVVVHGTPFSTIIDTARKEGADLIVIGTHGRTGLKHALIGSVAERVVRQATCPVLVVRPQSMMVHE